MRNGTKAADNKPAFDIWAIAKQLQKKQPAQSNQQKTIIVLGDRNSGKSSFVKVLKAQTDTQVKPTGALQYTFIKRSTTKKELVHSYEIAGKNLRGIIQSLITKQNYQNLFFIIVVDISNPAESVETAAEWLQIVKSQMNGWLQKGLEQGEQKAYFESVVAKYANHQDSGQIEPLPVQTVLVGNKYDLYEKFDPEIRKWVSRTLRYLSLVYGCTLVYCSIKAPQLTAQVRSVFQTLFFGQNPSNLTLTQKDHMKPIFVMNNLDNIGSMSLPHPGSLPMAAALKKHISGLVQPKQEKKNEEFNFSKYKETRIDSIVAERQKELEKASKNTATKYNGDSSPQKPNRK